jgi:N-methylhydantoinase B
LLVRKSLGLSSASLEQKDKVTEEKMAASDPITREVLRHQIIAVPNQIERNVERTAFSPLINEYKDYAVGFVDPAGRLVAQSRGSLPIFVANALGTAIREGLSVLGAENINDGDVIITNTAAWLGQHLNNVAAYTPVRFDGELIGFFAVLFHWIDVGGAVPGSCLSSSTSDVWQEGIQFPTVKLVEAGVRREDIFRLIRTNTRFPDFLMGDVEAQLNGCIVGHDLMLKIVTRYGIEAFKETVQSMWADADLAVGKVLAEARPGIYFASAQLDNDGRGEAPVDIKVKVDVSRERIVVDLSGLADQVEGPYNAGKNGGANAAARIACKYLLSPDTPVNDGDFTRLEVVVREGTFLSARPDAPIGHSGSTIPTVVDTILRALSEAFPSRAAAAHHGIYGIHAISGRHDGDGERYYNLDTAIGGWGASGQTDGPGPFRSNSHGDVPSLPIEMQEALYPYRFVSQRLRADTGGAGEFRGGLGIEKVYEILQTSDLLVSFDRLTCPPWGVHGGGAGGSAGVKITRKGDGASEALTKGERRLEAGDVFQVSTGGGGGYGDAFDRQVEAVARDVRLGYVSREKAAEDYGVMINDDGTLDERVTKALRSSRKGKTAA